MDAAALFEATRTALGGLLSTLGLAFVLGGAIGQLRLPDFYTRLHAATAADTAGAALVALGLALAAPSLAIAARVLLVGALMVALGPVLTHALASAAHGGGLAPVSGGGERGSDR